MPSRFLGLSLRGAAVLVTTSVALAVAGCPDPEQTFEDFGERYADINKTTVSASTGPATDCTLPEVGGEVDGTYLFALSPGQLGESVAKKPLLFIGAVTILEGAAGVEVNFKLTPLGTPYRNDDEIPDMDPVGPEADLGNFPLNADGTFVAELPQISVDGKANPVSPGTLVATVTLSGQICGNAEAEGAVKLGFFCGTVEGVVTEPTDVTLEAGKNTFTFTKYDGTLPAEVPFNCAGDLANPIGG